MDVDEPLSDHQKALRERASSSIFSLQKSLSSPVTPPKHNYDHAVNRLRNLLDRYEATKLASPTEAKRGSQPSTEEVELSTTPKVEELAPLLNDQHAVLRHLEQQVHYYKTALSSVRQKTEAVIKENEDLHQVLKDQIVSRALGDQDDQDNDPNMTPKPVHKKRKKPRGVPHLDISDDSEEQEPPGSPRKSPRKTTQVSRGTQVQEAEMGLELTPSPDQTTSQRAPLGTPHGSTMLRNQEDQNTTAPSFLDQVFLPPSQRRFIHELESEVEKIRGLHQAKTRRLESLLYSTRDELEDYKAQVSKLQEKQKADELRIEQSGQPSVCVKCARQEALLSPRHGNINVKTIDKLSRERDELMETLANQKKSLEEVRQRELESYMQVKHSCEMVEQAQLEKAEIMIQVHQLRDEIKQQRERHEKLAASSSEKFSKESEKTRHAYQKDVDALNNKLQGVIDKNTATEHQLERVTREKVDLTAELESAKAQILAHKAQMESLTEEMLVKVNNAVKDRTLAQQEMDSVKTGATHAARDREQERIRLTTQMEEMRRRLKEAEEGWMDNKEECIRLTEKVHTLEREVKTAVASKDALNKSRLEEIQSINRQAQHREQQLTVLLEEADTRNAQAREELEQMLQAEIEVAHNFRQECKRLNRELDAYSTRTRTELQQSSKESEHLRTRLEEALKRQRTLEAENLQSAQLIEKITEKLRLADQTTKKYSKQTFDLLSKQTHLMKDRQILCRELEYLRAQAFQPTRDRATSTPTETPDDLST